MIAQGRVGRYLLTRNLIVALAFTGASDEARAASESLVADAEVTENPIVIGYALLAYGYARRGTDPATAYEGFRRALTIARDSGNRQIESHLARNLSMLAATHGNPVEAFDHLTLEIRNHYDSGSFSLMLTPLAILAAVLDGLGCNEPAATISGFAGTPFTRASFPEMNTVIDHLREVLGSDTYESLARAGENMTNAEMATYALDQIVAARASSHNANCR